MLTIKDGSPVVLPLLWMLGAAGSHRLHKIGGLKFLQEACH